MFCISFDTCGSAPGSGEREAGGKQTNNENQKRKAFLFQVSTSKNKRSHRERVCFRGKSKGLKLKFHGSEAHVLGRDVEISLFWEARGQEG